MVIGWSTNSHMSSKVRNHSIFIHFTIITYIVYITMFFTWSSAHYQIRCERQHYSHDSDKTSSSSLSFNENVNSSFLLCRFIEKIPQHSKVGTFKDSGRGWITVYSFSVVVFIYHFGEQDVLEIRAKHFFSHFAILSGLERPR